MTIKRFRALAASFGSDLRLWPDHERGAAEALLARSAPARLALERERVLDDAIRDAGAVLDEAHSEPGGDAAALARLRSGVSARIAPLARPPSRRGSGLTVAALSGQGMVLANRPMLLVTAGCATVLAGLLIGALQATPPVGPDIMVLLQATPLTGLP